MDDKSIDSISTSNSSRSSRKTSNFFSAFQPKSRQNSSPILTNFLSAPITPILNTSNQSTPTFNDYEFNHSIDHNSSFESSIWNNNFSKSYNKLIPEFFDDQFISDVEHESRDKWNYNNGFHSISAGAATSGSSTSPFHGFGFTSQGYQKPPLFNGIRSGPPSFSTPNDHQKPITSKYFNQFDSSEPDPFDQELAQNLVVLNQIQDTLLTPPIEDMEDETDENDTQSLPEKEQSRQSSIYESTHELANEMKVNLKPSKAIIKPSLTIQKFNESFSSTFYKRNLNGYMFIRETNDDLIKIDDMNLTLAINLGSINEDVLVDTNELRGSEILNDFKFVKRKSNLKRYHK